MHKATLGVIVGNRGFFPSHLCETGRQEVLRVLAEEGIQAVVLGSADTPFGSVETLHDAEKCAALFQAHRAEIDGILVTLPNFGDERGVANAVRLAELNVPVLVQAFPDDGIIYGYYETPDIVSVPITLPATRRNGRPR